MWVSIKCSRNPVQSYLLACSCVQAQNIQVLFFCKYWDLTSSNCQGQEFVQGPLQILLLWLSQSLSGKLMTFCLGFWTQAALVGCMNWEKVLSHLDIEKSKVKPSKELIWHLALFFAIMCSHQCSIYNFGLLLHLLNFFCAELDCLSVLTLPADIVLPFEGIIVGEMNLLITYQ